MPVSKSSQPGSSSSAIRSRAVRRFFACCDSIAFGPPPWRSSSSSLRILATRAAIALMFFSNAADLVSTLEERTLFSAGGACLVFSAMRAPFRYWKVFKRASLTLQQGPWTRQVGGNLRARSKQVSGSFGAAMLVLVISSGCARTDLLTALAFDPALEGGFES